MKKLMFILAAVFCMLFTSCETEAQVTYRTNGIEYAYYDYEYDYPIVYIESVPHYCIWNVNTWVYWAVPRDRFVFIRHYHRPRTYYPHHYMNHYNHFYHGGSHYNHMTKPNMHHGNNRPSMRGGTYERKPSVQPQQRHMFNQGQQMRGMHDLPRGNVSTPRGGGFQSSPRSFQGSSSRGGRR